MIDKKRTGPPRWMDWVVELYCKADLLEDLQGDLHEYYNRNLVKGRFKANLIFFFDVLKFCRLYTIRKPKILKRMTFFNLIENYFKTSVRSLARNRLFSSINVIGLAIAMSIGILMITYLSELLSYDTFHEKADRTYRVITTYQDISSDDPLDLASTSVFIGKKLKEDYPGLEKVLLMRRSFREDLKIDESVISVRGVYSGEEFFDVFSFELLSGNPATALTEPNTLVLTEKIAKKLFDDKDPVGQIVEAGEERFTITGVMKDIPSNSHMKFEVLASFKTLENRAKKNENTSFYGWRNIWMYYAYILLEEGKSAGAVDTYLGEIAKVENAKTDRFTIFHRLENLLEISPGKKLSNGIGPSITWQSIYQLMGLTLIIIVSACFNYTNLSIARSLRRAKEVGVRKIVGASRGQVFSQFTFEAVIISLIALLISFGLFLLIKGEFVNTIIDSEDVDMTFNWIHLLYSGIFAITIGLVAGMLPSLFLSKLKAISVLSDVSKVRLFKGLTLRKVLIVIQFSLSMALIIGATISYKQYKYSLNFDLGFSTENILNLSLNESVDSELLTSELSKLSEISMISKAGMALGTGEIWGDEVKYKDPMDSVEIYINFVDKNYLEVHDFELVAGGTFPFDLKEGDSKFIIIDERLRERLGIRSPQDAIGEILHRGDIPVEIVGVIENYQYTNISDEMEPSAFIHGGRDNFYLLNLVVKTNDMIEFMGKLESIWNQFDKVHPFRARFFDQQIEDSYADNKAVFRVFTFLAILAISISSMGLLGMAVFTAETRSKEVSVRKVLGATEKNLIFLLSKSFFAMLGISAIIAIPFAYYFFEALVLEDFANRITIGPVELLSGVALIFGIGISTIAWQASKAAKTNPADMLRNE